MVSYSTSDFKVGLKIIIDNDPCVIIEEEFNKPGKGQAFSKIKFRNFLTGRVGEKTCKVGESLESADVEELDMQFLYSDDSTWFFMHPETYDQIPVSVETVGELGKWVTEEDICKILLWNDKPISVVAPTFVAFNSPSLNNNIVGIPLTPYFVGVLGSLSILCFAIVTCEDISSESSSRIGPIILQGPHHSAQKSTSTGNSDAITSV